MNSFKYSSPGRIIQRELDARKWTHEHFAEIMELSVQDIDKIISGDMQITQTIAGRLADVFETSIQLWLNLENNYRSKNDAL